LYLNGLGARCVQHECDHLNGVLFLQRASRLKLERALKSRPKERRKREDYERRIAIARAIQERDRQQSNDDTSDNGGGIEESDKVVSNT
jgi:dephospho-CoA kinase